MRKLILLFLFPFFLYGQGPISGFRAPEGEIAVALTYSTESFDTYLQPTGNEDRELTAVSYNLFMEAATGSRTSVVLTLPYVETDATNRGLQDASVWLKYLNFQKINRLKTTNVFTAVGLTFPIGNYPTDNPAAIGQQATVFQGRLAYQLRHESGWFINAISGIDFQIAPDSRAAWPLLLRGGFGGPWLYVEAWYELMQSLEAGTSGSTSLAGTGSSWNRVGTTFYVPIRPWVGVTLGGAWILSGEFIGQSSRLNFGTVFKL